MNVTGIDISGKSIEICSKKFPKNNPRLAAINKRLRLQYTTDATNEHLTLSLLHDGLTTVETEYGWIGTTASRELEYVVTTAAELTLDLWSNSTGKAVKFYIRGVAGGGMN